MCRRGDGAVRLALRAEGEVRRRAGLKFSHIPLPFHRADPGLPTEIDCTIPGRSSGQKLVFANVLQSLLLKGPTCLVKMNAPGQTS